MTDKAIAVEGTRGHMGSYGELIGKWVKLSDIPPPPPPTPRAVSLCKNSNHSFIITSLITFLCIVSLVHPINLN